MLPIRQQRVSANEMWNGASCYFPVVKINKQEKCVEKEGQCLPSIIISMKIDHSRKFASEAINISCLNMQCRIIVYPTVYS